MMVVMIDMYICMNMIVFMYVHMCTYCVCMYFMTIYNAVRILLELNCVM